MSTLLTLAEQTALPPYRPFIDPIQVHGSTWLWMVIPLSFGVAVVYKAVRMPAPGNGAYWLGVLKMMIEIIAGMAFLAALSYVLVLIYAHWLAG